MVGRLNFASVFTIKEKKVCGLQCIFVAFNCEKLQTYTNTLYCEVGSFRSIKTRQPLSSLSHHYSSSRLLYGYDCSFVSVGCFPRLWLHLLLPPLFAIQFMGPTHTHSWIPLSFIMGIPGTCEWSREAVQIPLPLQPVVSPHSHGFLMGVKQTKRGGRRKRSEKKEKEEEKGRRARLIHQ